jgi:hypothetical protein
VTGDEGQEGLINRQDAENAKGLEFRILNFEFEMSRLTSAATELDCGNTLPLYARARHVSQPQSADVSAHSKLNCFAAQGHK